MAKNPNGKALLKASFALFRQDPQMIWLPLFGAIASFIGFAVIAGPLGVLAISTHNRLLGFVAILGGSMLASIAAILFQLALVFAATDRIEGRTPQMGDCLSRAWQRRSVIFRWALFVAVVGTAIRLVEERLGIFGRILGVLGGLAWAVAIFLVVPVLAFEDLGPVAAVKRSAELLRARFGTIARSGLRFGGLFAVGMFACIAVLMVGAMTLAVVPGLGIVLFALGFLCLFGLSMLMSAAGMYLRTVLYRYSVGLSVPDLGVDLASVVVTKGGRTLPPPPSSDSGFHTIER